MDFEYFLHKVPKMELHAHLSGSLKKESLVDLGRSLGMDVSEVEKMVSNLTEFNDLNGCLKKFRIIHELTSTCAGVSLATLLAIRDFQLQNVVYLELRATPRSTKTMTRKQYIETVVKAVMKAHTIHKDMIIKFVPSIDRGAGVAAADEILNVVLSLQTIYKEFMPAIDFSGNPKEGKFKDYKPVLTRAREHGLGVVLHCGEINCPDEIAEMIDFGMDRCGHGTFLSDDQFRYLGSQNIPIECCLTSNIKCKTVPNIDSHHFKRIFKENMANTVLCTDDCGLFECTLRDELRLAFTAFNLRRIDILRLLTNSIKHAFADEATKEILRTRLAVFYEEHA